MFNFKRFFLIDFLLRSKKYRYNSDCSRLKRNYVYIDPLKLHFGCGPRILKGWINVDLYYESNYRNYKYGQKYYPKSIRGSREDFYMINIFDRSLPLPDKSVDIVFHEDFIEHLDQREQFQFLSEMLRVMKKGAVHRINTPNLLTALKGKSNFSKGMEGVYVDEWLRWGHKNVLTPTTLKEMAITVGYSKVVFNKRDGSISKLTPLEYRPASDRSSKDGNIFADLIK